MKPFFLFCFTHHSAKGGWNDFCGAFDSGEEAGAVYGLGISALLSVNASLPWVSLPPTHG
jgi:hypothetical protein